jgi:hypothetical protein
VQDQEDGAPAQPHGDGALGPLAGSIDKALDSPPWIPRDHFHAASPRITHSLAFAEASSSPGAGPEVQLQRHLFIGETELGWQLNLKGGI